MQKSFEKGEVDALIGGEPNPEVDSETNLISVFTKVIDPNCEPTKHCNDWLRVLLFQLCCLFVENAAAHIHDTNSK